MSKTLPQLVGVSSLAITSELLANVLGNPRRVQLGKAFQALGPIVVNSFYDGVNFLGPTGASQLLSTKYGSLAAARVDYPAALTLLDEVDWCAWQGAADAGYVASTARIIASGSYVINRTIVFNGAAIMVEGMAPNQRYGGTTIAFTGVGGSLNAPSAIFDAYLYTEFGAPPPGRAFNNAFAGIKFVCRDIHFGGKGGSTAADSGYVCGIRLRQATFSEFTGCSFDNNLYRGIFVTGPQLFLIIEKNLFGSINQDGINNANASDQIGGNSTTIWITHNEFIGCGRYGILLDLTGNAVQAMPIIRDNSQEFCDPAYDTKYAATPEWFVHGVPAANCFINCANMILDGHRFEHSGASLYWADLHITGSGQVTLKDSVFTNLFVTTSGNSQPRTDQMIAFANNPVAISGITRANPAVVTYSGSDNIANGDIVHIYGVAGMTQINNATSGGPNTNLVATPYTAANVNTGAKTFELQGVNSSAYSAYTSGGHATNGNFWSDITDLRNYTAGSTGNLGPVSDGMVLRNNKNMNQIFCADAVNSNDMFGSTAYMTIEDQPGTLMSIPTTNVTGGATVGGVAAKKVQARNVGVPTLLNYNQTVIVRGAAIFGTSGSRQYASFDFSTSHGNYKTSTLSPASWAPNTAYYTTTYGPGGLQIFGSSPFIKPTNANENGFFFQCTTPGTSGGTEPLWDAVIGHTTADGTAVWTCKGRVYLAAENNLEEWQEGGKRRRTGSALPTTGTFAVGDQIINTAPTAGGVERWVCTTAGIAGSTAVFKAVAIAP